jgi:tetratricopeptide (TPR) repeat protein/predicted Ser/Thr protein kinase
MSDGAEAARWERIKDLFAEALDADAAGRAALLERTRRADPGLADELDSLLASHARTDAFMAEPTLPPADWAVAEASPPLPETFGRYRIVSLLGAGGMGQVYLAHETALDRQVALKVLPESLAQRPGPREQLLREARAAAGLNHPNITTIHEIGAADGRDYIALEYVQGHSLRERLAAGPLPLRELLSVAVPLADALAYAHERGVIHRDIKPANIMVTERGLPKLLDFGLATSRRAASADQPGIAGTPAAMSPEQARGEPPDARSDVFSFGSLLYEMATGRPAFEGGNVAETLEAVVKQEPKSLTELRPELPRSFAAVVEQALRKDPAQRYQQMAELAQDLRRVELGLDRGAAGRRARRSAWGVGLVAAAGIALVLIRPWSSPPPHRLVVTVTGFDDPDDAADAEHIGAMLTRLVTTNLAASSGFDVVPEQRLVDAARQMGIEDGRVGREQAAAVAREAGADTLIVGRFHGAGGQLEASADISDLGTGQVLASLHARGAGPADLFTMADSLGHQIRAALKEPAMTGDMRRALEEQLTTSVEAFRAYVRGLEALLNNDVRGAVIALREATAIDPAFALAQYRLQMACIWTGDFEEASKAHQRTIAFREKLPQGLQLVLDALGPYYEGEDHRRVLPNMLHVLESQPYNHDALYMLGEIYTHSATRSDSSQAASMYERLLALDPGLSLVYDHRLQALLRMGRWADAQAQIDAWTQRAPSNLSALRATQALWEGRLDDASRLALDPLIPDFLAADDARGSVKAVLARSADQIVDELSDVKGAYLVLELDLRAGILVAHGRFDEAAELYRLALGNLPDFVSRDGFHTSLRNGSRQRLALLLALRGDLAAAREQTRAALAQQPESYRCLFMDGFLALRDGDATTAQGRLATLTDLAAANLSPAAPVYRDALAAELALAEGRPAEARAGFVALLESGRLMEDWYAHEDSIAPLVRDGLARACLAAGDADAAAAAWAALTGSGLERLRQPVPWVLSMFERGRLAMQVGRGEEARPLLEGFVQRWGAATELPQVIDARALLAR